VQSAVYVFVAGICGTGVAWLSDEGKSSSKCLSVIIGGSGAFPIDLDGGSEARRMWHFEAARSAVV